MVTMHKRISLSTMGLFLSLLVLATPFSMVSLNSQMLAQPMLISTHSEQRQKTTTALNETFLINETITTQLWSNGTKVIFSEDVRPNDWNIRRVRVNCTTWFNTYSSSEPTATTNAQIPLADNPNLFPGEHRVDILSFLPKGNNGTHFVSYDHDNNYDQRGYYPGEWYTPYSLNGLQKTHVHLAADLLDNWIRNVHDDITVLGLIICIASGAATLSLGILAGFFAVTIPAGVAMILGGCSTILGAILTYSGWTKENWIKYTVMERFAGDGWTWLGQKTITDLGERGYRPWLSRPSWITYNAHLVEWDQSWGAEGVFPGSPQHYSVECDESVPEKSSIPTGMQTFNWLGSKNGDWP